MAYTAFSLASGEPAFKIILELMKSTCAETPSILFKSSSSSLAQFAQHSPEIFIFSPPVSATTLTSSKLLQCSFTFSSVAASHSTITFCAIKSTIAYSTPSKPSISSSSSLAQLAQSSPVILKTLFIAVQMLLCHSYHS